MTNPLHSHQGEPGPDKSNDQKNLAIAFFLNAGFTIIEIAGGLFTNSIAIISDAVHDLGDTFSLGMAWYAERIARRKPDSRYTYGYKRFPVLAAMINSVFLLAASVFVFYQAIPLILHPEQVNETGMMWLAVLGIIFNGAAVLRLKGGTTLNQRVVRLHLLEDTLGWIAVLIGALVIKATGFLWIDPFLGVMIAVYIIFNAWKNLRTTLRILLQATPLNADSGQLEKSLLGIPGVESIHDIRTWTIDGNIHVFTLHLVTRKGVLPEAYPDIKNQVRKELTACGFGHVTIEIDSHEESCSLNHLQGG